jgi:membrane-bound lytic murein transglycosylase MltF
MSYLKRALLFTVMLAISAVAIANPKILAKAEPYLPMLTSAVQEHWPDAPLQSFFAAQVEKESMWNPKATLRTSREWGAGFAQFTVAYRADGSVLFDKMAEVRAAHQELADWVDRYDPAYSLKAMVLLDRSIYARLSGKCGTVWDCLQMTASAYNGGEGGVMQDRLKCRNTPGCDPMTWGENVALTSTKSRVKWQGYGQSAYDINRGYASDLKYSRRYKYVSVLGN